MAQLISVQDSLMFHAAPPDKDNRMILREILVRSAAAAVFGGACLLMPGAGLMASLLGLLLLLASSISAAALEKRHMRGPTASALIALVDAAALSSLLASLGALEAAGSLLLLPGLWAVSRFSSSPVLIAPATAGILAASASLWTKDGLSPAFYPSLLAILLALPMGSGSLISRRLEAPIEPLPDEEVVEEDPSDLLKLRESYRSLRDQYLILEQKSRTGRLAKRILEAAFAKNPWQKLADSLCADTGVIGLRLYASSLTNSRLVWRASSGVCRDAVEGPKPASGTGIGGRAIKKRLDSLAAALKQEGTTEPTSSLLIKEKGKVIGLIMMDARSEPELASAEEKLRPALSLLGQTLLHLSKRSDEQRRSREAEILYSVVSLARGAASQKVVAERIAADLMEVIPADSLSISLLTDSGVTALAHVGRGVEPLNLHSFAHGPGWQGWMRSGSPEILVMDPSEDMRVDQDEALRSRVRSLCIVPLSGEGKVIGWLSASSPRAAALDESHLTTLRIACSELGPALKSASQPRSVIGSGLATSKEFVQALKNSSDGVLVAVEIVGLEDLRRRFGAAALAQAISRTTSLLIAKTPARSLVCRREEGAYAILLRGSSRDDAESWASEVTASASVITLASPDGSARLCLGLRAKALDLNESFSSVPLPKKLKVKA